MQAFKALGQIVASTISPNLGSKKKMIDADKIVIASSYVEAVGLVADFYLISVADAARLIRNNPICTW